MTATTKPLRERKINLACREVRAARVAVRVVQRATAEAVAVRATAAEVRAVLVVAAVAVADVPRNDE